MKQGDLVVRKSYGGDVIFKIQDFSYQTALLRGVDVRLLADASVADLSPAPETRIARHEEDMQQRCSEMRSVMTKSLPQPTTKQAVPAARNGRQSSGHFEVPGNVLHLDGDPNYPVY